MATEGTHIGWRADPDTREAIDRYAERHGHENRTDAVEELIDVGLREQSSPILYRFKDRVIDWVNQLSFGAVLIALIGLTTRIVDPIDGLIAAFFMLGSAAALLAGFALVRFLSGSNERGAEARRAIAAIGTVVGRDG